MKSKSVSKTSSSLVERLRHIEGRHNALIKELRRAFSKGELTEAGECAIEGVRIIEEAIRSGLRFRAVFFSEAARAKVERLLPQLAAHVETVMLPDKLFAGVVPSDSPQGVAALVQIRSFPLEDLFEKVPAGPLLAIDGLQDPGNLGTILRSAEAFGAGGLLLGEGTVAPFNSKVVRASAGSIFRMPVVGANLAQVIPPLREHGYRLLATSSHKGSPLRDTKLSSSMVLFIGGEGGGVSRGLLNKMDEIVTIPHSPQVESLNAAVAASIVLYEYARQRF